MKSYILKRFLQLIPVVILVSIFSYLIYSGQRPGDPIDNYSKPGMTKEQIEIIKKEYHLDGNIVEQYLTWAGHVLRGDFGTSISQNRPVAQMIGERLPATLLLMGTSLLISLVAAIPLGLWAGMKKNKMADNVIGILSYIGYQFRHFGLQ